jgi:hypothetical protein
MIHQHPMIVASRFKADPDGQAVFSQDRDEPHKIVGAVGDRQAPSPRLAGDGNQHLVPVFGNVDAYQNTGIRSMLNLGHGRSPLWCGSQNHHRDPRPGYGRLLRNFGGCAGGHNLQQRAIHNMLRPGIQQWQAADMG